ncbi:hypothetical protein Tco_0649631 [Tanacetum coccineum]
MPMATLERRSIVNIESGKRGCRSKGIRKENRKKRREKIPTFKKKAAASNRSLKQRDAAVWSHHQNSREAGVSKDISGDEGLRSEGTELIQIFIKDGVTFTTLKQST